MIVGNRRVREGEIFINGIPVQNMAVKDRKAMGLGYIPSDRHKNAMIPSFSITENSCWLSGNAGVLQEGFH